MASILLVEDEPTLALALEDDLQLEGYAVELAGLTCCGRAMISKGFLSDARDLARAQISALAARVGDGTPVLGLEPSCLSALADEWPELVPGNASRQLAAATHLADAWLAEQVASGRSLAGAFRRAEDAQHRGGLRRRIGQRLRAQQSAAAGPRAVRAAPDFRRPVGRLAGVVERGAHLDDHCGAHRLERKFLLAPPAHADRRARFERRDDRRVGCRVVGAIVAVAARALPVPHLDILRIEPERLRERRPQRKNTLRMCAHRQVAVANTMNRTL